MFDVREDNMNKLNRDLRSILSAVRKGMHGGRSVMGAMAMGVRKALSADHQDLAPRTDQQQHENCAADAPDV